MHEGETLELRIERIVSGGEGLGFADGLAIFVPLSAPGDLLRVRVLSAKGGWAKAEPLELLEAGPGRGQPLCPLFGTCGGCDLMHLSREAELAAKQGILAESFARIGKLAAPQIEVHAGSATGYRNRLRLRRGYDGAAALNRRRSREAISLPDCPIAAAPIAAWIRERARLHDMAERRPEPGAEDETPGLTVFGSGDSLYVEGRDETAEATLLGRTFRFPASGFFQSNLDMLERLIPLASGGLEGEAALDLYGGVGIFGAFLADHFARVLSVEGNARSAPYAAANLGPRGRARQASVESWIRSREAGAPWDLILVDPPRSGLSPELKAWLAARKPSVLSYVSCDPATLARDSGELVRSGLVLERLALFDFYPGTRHIEAWARFSRA